MANPKAFSFSSETCRQKAHGSRTLRTLARLIIIRVSGVQVSPPLPNYLIDLIN